MSFLVTNATSGHRGPARAQRPLFPTLVISSGDPNFTPKKSARSGVGGCPLTAFVTEELFKPRTADTELQLHRQTPHVNGTSLCHYLP